MFSTRFQATTINQEGTDSGSEGSSLHIPDSRWRSAAFLSICFCVLIAVAIGDRSNFFFLPFFLVVIAGGALFHLLFHGSRFLSIALTNYLAIYACMYAFFVETNPGQVSTYVLYIGFSLPILAFLGGAWWRRKTIRRIVNEFEQGQAEPSGRIFLWFIPVISIAVVLYLLPYTGLIEGISDELFLLSMGTMALCVFLLSTEIWTFLLETGLMFEEFFNRASNLLIPTFAFSTFYSLIVIVYACIYQIIDRYLPGNHFLLSDPDKQLGFTESLYFSIITLSTVGYGDVAPLSAPVRLVVAVQIITGVLMLLFGFYELVRYTSSRRIRRRPQQTRR